MKKTLYFFFYLVHFVNKCKNRAVLRNECNEIINELLKLNRNVLTICDDRITVLILGGRIENLLKCKM